MGRRGRRKGSDLGAQGTGEVGVGCGRGDGEDVGAVEGQRAGEQGGGGEEEKESGEVAARR